MLDATALDEGWIAPELSITLALNSRGGRGFPEVHPRAHRPPFLSQHPRQAELRKDTAIGEPHNGRDVAALKGQHN